jgi:hypothetical protein
MDQDKSNKVYKIVLKTIDSTNIILLDSKKDLKIMERKAEEDTISKPKRRKRTQHEIDENFRMECNRKQQNELEKLEERTTRSKSNVEKSVVPSSSDVKENAVADELKLISGQVAELKNIIMDVKSQNAPKIFLVSMDRSSEGKIRKKLDAAKADYETINTEEYDDNNYESKRKKVNLKDEEVRSFTYLPIMDLKPKKEESEDVKFKPKMLRKFRPPVSKHRKKVAETLTKLAEEEIKTETFASQRELLNVAPSTVEIPQETIVNLNSEKNPQEDLPVNIDSTDMDAQPSVHQLQLAKFHRINAWLARNQGTWCVKFSHVLSKMQVKISLIATFKCMAKNCSYTTTDPNNFKKHLEFHQTKEDVDEFLNFCPYCFFKGRNFSNLIDHYNSLHQYDKFQCGYCFYRSADEQSTWEHIRRYHGSNPILIFECPLKNADQDEKTEARLKRKRNQNVKPLPCSGKFKN